MSQALLSERAPSARRLAGASALDSGVAAVGAGLAVGGVAAAAGGYFPTSWGWTAIAFFWATAIALLLRGTIELGVPELVFFGALSVYAGWIWLATTWSESTPSSFLEGERMLVYVGGAAAALLLVRRRSAVDLLAGVLTAITLICAYGLATRLFPNRIGSFDPIAEDRLEAPIGYTNALGIFAVMGVLLALGFAARGRSSAARALGAAALAILVPTIYFTFSRGAWIALGLGLVVAIAFERRRLQLVTAFGLAAAAPAFTVAIASRSSALTHDISSVDRAAHDGARLAIVVAAAAIVSAVLMLALARAERAVRPPTWVRAAYAGMLVALLAAGLAAAIARYGSPPTMARKAYDAFITPPQNGGTTLNSRLFSLYGSHRSQLWHVAWHDYEAHPWLGSGPGTFEQEWNRHRTITLKVRDAHNLYLEQLAEVGPVGLGLLAVALGVPLVAAARARGARLAGPALAAYVAFLVHAAVDWDWEMTAVTLSALLCGIAVLALARGADREERSFALPVRLTAVGATAALAALAFVGLVGNLALASSIHAAGRADWQKAAAQARRASDWAPWSSDALDLLGQAELHQGRKAAAAASFRRALAKDPKRWDIWLDLYAAASGPEAAHAFRRAYQLNPKGDTGGPA
jgi:O-Antigen ligase